MTSQDFLKKAERPILFSGPMVRAILEGRKTQTRRVVNDVIPWATQWFSDSGGTGLWMPNGPSTTGRGCAGGHWRPCPYGKAGDRLWVRETWQGWKQVSIEYDEWEPVTREYRSGRTIKEWVEEYGEPKVEYRATSESAGPWAPAIHMPRWASRSTLEVTEVRVQRLLEISDDDARAEGYADAEAFLSGDWASPLRDANPWVWCVTFRRSGLPQ